MLRSCLFALATVLISTTAAAQPGYGRPGGGEVQCSSRDYNQRRCDVPWSDARLVRQLSSTRCERGRNWGVDRRGIWVDGGCSGVFVEAGGRHPGGHGGHGGHHNDWRPGPNWDRNIRLRCESRDYRYHMCRVDTGRGSRVFIDSQISRTRCVEGRNWGWNRAGIWVAEGCAAVFVVDRRWR
jgi:hypothetical protein